MMLPTSGKITIKQLRIRKIMASFLLAWPAILQNYRTMHRIMVMALWVGLALTSLAAEKLSSGFLAKGTKWETPVFQRDSGAAGPTVFITGGVHGNEPAGARAAEQIRHWPTCPSHQ